MLELFYKTQFKKDMKAFRHNELVLRELSKVLKLLQSNQKLPNKYRLHQLIGRYWGKLECHLRPDVLLIFELTKTAIHLERIGSHSDLF